MKQLLMIVLSVCYVSSHAQGFIGGTYSPKPCTENDSIVILDTIDLNTADYRLNSYFYQKSDSLILHICYRNAHGPLGGQTIYETTNIGKLSKGIYVVVLKGTYISDTACITGPPLLNSICFPLEVLAAPTSIDEQTLSPTYLQSSLIQGELILQSLPAHSSILVYDMQGRQCYRKENESGEASIDASGWSRGIYIVFVQAGNERKRWRVVKE